MAATLASERLIVTTEEAELKKRGYNLGSTLGEGSYAKVKSAFADKENKKVAIKIINQRRAPKDFRERFLPRELDILHTIRHNNLVNMFEIFRMSGKVSSKVINCCAKNRNIWKLFLITAHTPSAIYNVGGKIEQYSL